MIRFTGVTVRYGAAPKPALDGVSLEAPDGAITAVVGPNGSGKSTLVRALLARVPLEAGSIAVDGIDLAGLGRREVARRVAVLVQREEPAFPMRVREFIALGHLPRLGAWGTMADGNGAVRRAAAQAGVEELLDRASDTLSGGEWQRVRIARALAQEARAIVMDEPTSFLDIAHEMQVFELLDQLAAGGRTVLVVSHQLNLVTRFARHVVLLHRGRVVTAGRPDEVMQASTLESVYEHPLVVTRDPAIGVPSLLPLRRPARPLD